MMKDKIVYFIIALIAFGVLSSCTAELVTEYRDSYSVLHANKTKGIIVSKRAEKGLYSSPTYYADVMMYEGKVVPEPITNEVRVTKKQIQGIDLGEEIAGYTVNGRQFHTLIDMLHDGFFYLLFIGLGILVMVGMIIWGLYQIKPIQKFILFLLGKFDKMLKKLFALSPFKKAEFSFTKFILIIVGMGYLVLASSFANNLYHKIKPYGKVLTDAEVTFKTWDIYLDHDHLPVTKYYFTLEFLDEKNEDIEVTKEVSRSTYNKYESHDTLQISYLNNNPYQVFIQRLSFWEILSSLFTLRMQVILFPFIILLGVGLLELILKDSNETKQKPIKKRAE